MASFRANRVTGVAYDSCLEDHYSLWNKDYTEHPLRTRLCIERCESLGLLTRCKRCPVREATHDEILVCHTKQHQELLRNTQWMDEKELQTISQQYDYSYFHQKSFINAKLALGATIDLVEEVVTGKTDNGMALVRPPGHHAMKEEFSGYCYFNNVAVAAQLMMDRHGLERIIILDWDVHHGQGSQFLFYDDPRVLYVSIHRYEHGVEWPCLRESDYDFIGEGAGKGFNINLPLNEIGCGNDEFLSMFFNVLLPVFQEFNPQLFLVSAGFDSAIGCPEGEMTVTPACFAHFVNLLTPLASGKLALVLEGGYNLKSLPESAALCLRALLGDPVPAITPISLPKKSVIESVLNAVKCLHPHWKSLCYPDVVARDSISDKTYPYPSVLQNPPKQGIDFYTRDNRPKFFPLIQECVGDNVMDTMEDLNKHIDDLIKNTSLACPQYKLHISHADCGASRQLFSCLCENLKAKDLWKLCSNVHTPDENIHSQQSYISQSIDTIMNGKSQASLIINDCASKSDNSEGHLGLSNVASAIQYAMNNCGIRRTLVLQILDSNSVPAITEVPPGVLNVTLSLPGYDGKNKMRQSMDCDLYTNGNGKAAESRCVNIPFTQNPVTDADILTVFQLIALPVSYEFCPELVLFLWDTTTTVSGPVMETITQYLHGLARGNLLMFVNIPSPLSSPSSGNGKVSHENENSDSVKCGLVTQCTSILLGEKCSPQPAFKLSDRTTGLVKETLDKLKHQWKSFVYRGFHFPEHLKKICGLSVRFLSQGSIRKLEDSHQVFADQKRQSSMKDKLTEPPPPAPPGQTLACRRCGQAGQSHIGLLCHERFCIGCGFSSINLC